MLDKIDYWSLNCSYEVSITFEGIIGKFYLNNVYFFPLIDGLAQKGVWGLVYI